VDCCRKQEIALVKQYVIGFWLLGFLVWNCGFVNAQGIVVQNVAVRQLSTEVGGRQIIIDFELAGTGISAQSPAYVFVRYSVDGGSTWQLLSRDYFSMGANDLFVNSGKHQIVWWGVEEVTPGNSDDLQVRVRATQMQAVPGGTFLMLSEPAQGRHLEPVQKPEYLPLFYMMRYETTVAQYTEYLNEMGGTGAGYSKRMAVASRCGIIQSGDNPNFRYTVMEGREQYPVTWISWYDAVSYLKWCGLRLPTEAQWEKACRGGLFIDGDEKKHQKNPLPERKFPWGDETPNADGIWRCNLDGDKDGYPGTAPVGSFAEYASPYGICDLAGNVAEWTRDWYTTTYHEGLDGFRVLRGGSWMAMPAGVSAITGATQFPLRQSSSVGFRGVR
jgi:formylglycine-generating enzyme required for sulfatase activity